MASQSGGRMKILLFSFCFLQACASVPQNNGINDQLAVKEAAPETYVVTDKAFYDSNILVAVMENRQVLIASSPFETAGATALIEWIHDKFSPTKIVAINTHFHADGTGGNEAFNRAGVETWASEQTQKLHAHTGVPASKTFKQDDGMELNFGEEKVKVVYPGPAHSPDNIVVYFPKRDLLFAGCMIRETDAKSLGNTHDADLKHWAESARKLQAFSANTVVPGHGRYGGPELIDHTISLAGRKVK
jgi:glyoxylase-like metal-dependent hydrolase (beta-lactamase superfamily II)